MNHLVIDYQQRQRYIFIFVATIVFSFLLGFWFGYHAISVADNAAKSSADDPQLQADNANPAAWSDESVASQVGEQAPASTKPAPRTDKPVTTPRPEVQVRIAPPVATLPVVKVVAPVIAPPAPVVVSKPAPPPAPIISAPAPVADVSAGMAEPNVNLETGATQFTVQAGVFDNRDNALKLVNELNAKGFDAYADEFISTAGELKFNVRFSRSSDRDYVQRRLTRYKQLYTTAAYIIAFDK